MQKTTNVILTNSRPKQTQTDVLSQRIKSQVLFGVHSLLAGIRDGVLAASAHDGIHWNSRIQAFTRCL